MSLQASNLSRMTARSLPSMSAPRSLPRKSRCQRPVRLLATWSALRPVPTRAAVPAALSIEDTIGQWIDANPPQLYRGGA